MEFEWNRRKAESNLAKYGVSFEQATRAFGDPNAIEYVDERRNYGEARVIWLGYADVVLTVVYTERETHLRIISARRATRHERQRYYGQAAR
jgi:uncharacterized DUF497 family protein